MPSPPSQRARAERTARPGLQSQSAEHRFHEQQAIVVLDEEGQIQHVSRNARQLLGLGKETIAGLSFFEHVHPDHLNRVKWDLVQMIGRGIQRVTWLLRLKTGLGPWAWFKLQAANRLQEKATSGIVLWLSESRGRRQRA